MWSAQSSEVSNVARRDAVEVAQTLHLAYWVGGLSTVLQYDYDYVFRKRFVVGPRDRSFAFQQPVARHCHLTFEISFPSWVAVCKPCFSSAFGDMFLECLFRSLSLEQVMHMKVDGYGFSSPYLSNRCMVLKKGRTLVASSRPVSGVLQGSSSKVSNRWGTTNRILAIIAFF